ncbi:MAG: SDR family NAD(P)-dependent oxidoreductase [Legionella sp.]
MLKKKNVFITGASSGIGLACAKEFAAQGANLLLCARRIELLATLAEDLISEYGIDIYPFELDVRDSVAVKRALYSLPSHWQDIDILINNAGLAAGLDHLQDGTVDDWDQMIDTNIKGLLYVTREVIPQMIGKNSGHIINIGSIAGYQTYPKGAVYCATKHAVLALSEGLRMDLLGSNIRVSTISPGFVETNFSLVRFKGDVERASSVYAGMTALLAEDIAEAVVYCATRKPHVNISELLVMPTDQASVNLIARRKADSN